MPAKRTTSTRKPSGASHPYSKAPQPDESRDDSDLIQVVRPLGVETPLECFFSQYPEFQSQPSNSPVAEFNRLCKESKWKKDDPEKDAARHMFNIAIKEEFDDLYGSDEKDINNWHKLCRVLKVDPVPETLQGCRAVVLMKHVNLVDLVQGDKKDVHIFKTEKELSKYTRETGKFFPKEDAVDGGVLRALRRHILSPRDDGQPESRGHHSGRRSRRTNQR